MVILAPNSVGQTTLGQHDVVLPPQLILRDILKEPPDLTTLTKEQQPQSQLSSQAYGNYAMGPPQVRVSEFNLLPT